MQPTETHLFLIKAATLLHRYGAPSHRLERVMTEVANNLGVRGVFLYTPTGLVISITDATGEFSMIIVAMSLVGGILTANAVVLPKRIL